MSGMMNKAARVGVVAGMMLVCGGVLPRVCAASPDNGGVQTGSKDTQAKAKAMAAKAIAWLRTKQDEKSGGWGVNPKGPAFPAVTGLVVSGMIGSGTIESVSGDAAIARGVEFILSKRQPDGGLYDQVLPAYNTAICLSTISKIDTPAAKAAIKPAQDFLRSLQWSEAAVADSKAPDAPKPVGREHAYYGGVGYGKHGRPDLSNLSFVLQGLHDSGVKADDEAFKRAMAFLQRTQMLGSMSGKDGEKIVVNDMPYAKGSTQGGFIYSTSVNKDQVGVGQSYGGTIEETMDDGSKVSHLRAYGSMTYAGFKSYLYAGLTKDDARVKAAMDWIRTNYTLEENPNCGTDGLYYYLVTFSRALGAFGEPTLDVVDKEKKTTPRDWRADLVERLSMLQNEDGSFRSVDDRWMENDPVLITAYALIALGEAAH